MALKLEFSSRPKRVHSIWLGWRTIFTSSIVLKPIPALSEIGLSPTCISIALTFSSVAFSTRRFLRRSCRDKGGFPYRVGINDLIIWIAAFAVIGRANGLKARFHLPVFFLLLGQDRF